MGAINFIPGSDTIRGFGPKGTLQQILDDKLARLKEIETRLRHYAKIAQEQRNQLEIAVGRCNVVREEYSIVAQEIAKIRATMKSETIRTKFTN